MGSSPLTRGKHLLVGVEAQGRGLIPAHAGKTAAFTACGVGRRAHPRSRGENTLTCPWTSFSAGSSPLTRGKLLGMVRLPARRGLIPAHAGKTYSPLSTQLRARAHPRSRGENFALDAPDCLAVGSSPLTRGKRECHRVCEVLCGLIPAHAGKTGVGFPGYRVERAHPRSRGENPVVRLTSMAWKGSSPLTRGKPASPQRRTTY